MAILKNQVLGDPSGKVGGVVNRLVGKKVYIVSACKEFHKSESDASVAVRKRMVPMVAFSKAVNSFPELKAFWKKDKSPNGISSFNEIEKYNAKLFNQFRPTINNKIVDDGTIKCNIVSSLFNNTGISLEFSLIIPDDKKCQLINQFSALFVICLYDHLSSPDNNFRILTSRTEINDVQIDQTIKIEIPFTEELSNIVSTYKMGIIYFVLFAKDVDNSVIANSRNVSAEFDFAASPSAVRFPHPENRTTIKLQLSDYWTKNMNLELFMKTQNYYKNELGNQIMEFEVADPWSIVWWIMKLGRGVQVLEPLELRSKIIELADNISSNYVNDPIPPN